MFGRKGNYSTLEDDNQLQNVSKDRRSIYGSKGNRKTTLLVLAILCVIILLVVVLVPIVVVNVTHENNNNKGLLCPETVEQRVDCYPERVKNVTEDEAEDTCHSRGCCWVDGGPDGAPFCFFPDGYGYTVDTVQNTSVGVTVEMYKNESNLPYHGEVMKLKLEAYYETNSRLRVKVHDVCYYSNITMHALDQ